MQAIFKSILALLLFGLAVDVSAQIINVPKRIENKTVNRVNRKIDQGIDKGLDAVEGEVTGKNKKDDKTTKPENAKPDTKKTGSDSPTTGKQDQLSLQSFSKYDFVPGDKVLFYEDFSQDAVGDFPALWTTDVAGEINTLNVAPGNWLNLNSGEGTYWFMKDIEFPQNFILEMDIVPKTAATRIAADLVIFGESKHSEMDKDGFPGNCGFHIQMEKANWISRGYKKGETVKLEGTSSVNPVEAGKLNHVIIWVQNRRIRIYQKGAKVLDVPTNIYEGSKFNRLCFKLYRGASCASYISNIKITTAAPDMRNKLLTDGKLVTYGIYFDVNKDVVKPESYGTLNEIAKILNEVPDVKVKIVGHTDSDGADAANLDLSKRRSASVKAELAKSFGVNVDRLVTDGMGESQPVAPNDTPVNKALNRRVEFIKM